LPTPARKIRAPINFFFVPAGYVEKDGFSGAHDASGTSRITALDPVESVLHNRPPTNCTIQAVLGSTSPFTHALARISF
jgi:hypothetical protein